MKRILIVVLVSFYLCSIVSIPVSADPITAAFTPSIISAQVVRNTAEDGDIAYIFHYNLATDDDTYPETPASLAFIFRLYAADGATLLATTTPYAYYQLNYGYGQGAGSFYFDTAEAAALTWGAAYKINIAGSPIYFETLPDSYSYTLIANNYSSSTDQGENQAIVKDFILDICDDIETATDVTLKGNTDNISGWVLNGTGEAYFRGAIPGITAIAPDLFYMQYYVPETIDLDYDSSLGDTYATRAEAAEYADLMAGFDGIGGYLGVSGQFAIVIIFCAAALVMMLATAYKQWGVEPGMLAGGNVITCGALLFGDTLLEMQLIFGLIGAFIIFFSLYLKRA